MEQGGLGLGWGGIAAVNRCCQSDRRKEAETNAPHYSGERSPVAQ